MSFIVAWKNLMSFYSGLKISSSSGYIIMLTDLLVQKKIRDRALLHDFREKSYYFATRATHVS